MSDIAKRLSAAITAFTKIGKQNGSSPPDSKSNTLGLAYELLVAQKLQSVSKARVEAALNACREAGMIADSYTPGDHTPYTSDMLNINVKRNNDSQLLDSDKLRVELIKKLGAPEAQKLLSAASKPRKGNTTVSVSIVG